MIIMITGLPGLTDTYTSAVWIGYDLPKNMKSIESKKIHHTIFNQVMSPQ